MGCCHYEEGYDNGFEAARRGMTGNELGEAIRLYARSLDARFELEEADQVREVAGWIEHASFFAPATGDVRRQEVAA